MKLKLLVLSLFILPLGCGDNMSPEDYSHAWRASVDQYRAIDKNPDNQAADPAGIGDGSTEAHMRAASNISNQIRAVATSIKDLKPPPEFSQLQEETYIFYRGQADAYSGFSEALGTGDEGKITAAVNQVNNFAGEHVDTISKIIEGLGDKASMFRPSWQGVVKEVTGK